jgi:hypothetical protein
MTYQRGPDNRHPTDYIDRAETNVGWAPLILGVAFAALFIFLMFGASWNTNSSNRSTVSQRPELPNAPSVPVPAPPKPQ